MTRFEVLDHTADVAIRAYGESLNDLFENAARGMFHLIAAVGDTPPTSEAEIFIEAIDLETLLVGWLRELLLRFELQNEFSLAFSIESLQTTSLRGRVGLVTFDSEQHELLRHVKAITYHGLRVEQTDGGWQAMIVFDT